MHNWQEIEDMFNEAVAFPTGERTAFLRAKCGENKKLFGEVRQLLETDESASQLFETSAFRLATRLIESEFNQEFLKKPFAHYKKLKLLSRGNPHAVFTAENTLTKQREVLKILPSINSIDAITLKRFKREAEIASAVQHPYIVRFNNFGIFDKHYYIAMECVEGHSLRTIIKKSKIDPGLAISICRQLGEGLNALHSQGIIHGDIKPENILISNHKTAKIIDFGTSVVFDKSLYPGNYQAVQIRDVDKIIIGTPGYMSPEQLRGKPLTHHADLWSVAAIMHEMLTGRRLFFGLTTGEITDAMKNNRIQVSDKISLKWQFFFQKCFAFDIAARYDSAVTLAEEFRRMIGSSHFLTV